MKKSSCPFSENCKTGDFLHLLCEKSNPCSECCEACHIFAKKMVAHHEAKKNLQPDTSEILAKAS